MKKIILILIINVLLSFVYSDDLTFSWQLPIAIGDDRNTVYTKIGIPDEIFSKQTMPFLDNWPTEQANELFNSIGLMIIFWNDKVIRIGVSTYDINLENMKYMGKIVNGIEVDDDRNEVIKKLGKPSLMRSDPIYINEFDEFGLPLYSNSYYFWINNEYIVEIAITNTDQVLGRENKVLRPHDSIRGMFITDANSDMGINSIKNNE